MNHIAVTSELLASIAYDAENERMQVLFKRSGGLYNYDLVTPEEFEAVLNPSDEFEGSVGKAFNAIIKSKKPCDKVLGGLIVEKKTITVDAATEARIKTGAMEGFAPPAFSYDLPAPSVDQVKAGMPLPSEVQEVAAKSTDLASQAASIQVVDAASQTAASEILLAIAKMRREVAETFAPMKEAAFRAHRVICDQERKVDNPLAQAESAVKGSIGAFVLEQRRIAIKAEQDLRDAELARARAAQALETVETAIAQAVELERRGDTEAAEKILADPAPAPLRYVAPAPVAAATAEVKGVSTRLEWNFRIIDIEKVPREFLIIEPNSGALRAMAKSTKGKAKIAGVEFYEAPVVAASRGRN